MLEWNKVEPFLLSPLDYTLKTVQINDVEESLHLHILVEAWKHKGSEL